MYNTDGRHDGANSRSYAALLTIRTHIQEFVLGALLRPEGPKFEAESEGGVLGEGQRAPPPQARGLEERCKLTQRGPGRSPVKFGDGPP